MTWWQGGLAHNLNLTTKRHSAVAFVAWNCVHNKAGEVRATSQRQSCWWGRRCSQAPQFSSRTLHVQSWVGAFALVILAILSLLFGGLQYQELADLPSLYWPSEGVSTLSFQFLFFSCFADKDLIDTRCEVDVEVEVTVDNFLLKIILEGAHLRHKDSNNRGCKLRRRGTWAHIILGDYAYL